MYQRKQKVDKVSIYQATNFAKHRTTDIISNAEKLKNDPDKVERKKKNQCHFCYYSASRIGGAMITSQQCGICSKEMTFGSTCTDVICDDCAKENNLCKHCGGDIEMKHRRKPRKYEESEV